LHGVALSTIEMFSKKRREKCILSQMFPTTKKKLTILDKLATNSSPKEEEKESTKNPKKCVCKSINQKLFIHNQTFEKWSSL